MARATKGLRRIVVAGTEYRWRARGGDYDIQLTLWPSDEPNAILTASLNYGQASVPLDEGRLAFTDQIVITNRIVRRVIEHALQDHAYGTKPLNLRSVDAVIDVSDAVRA